MSPTLLARLRAADRATRALHWQVQRHYGDDGTRYPRDYYAPICLLNGRSLYPPPPR